MRATAFRSAISRDEVARMTRPLLGFSLRLAPSSVQHPEAGRGVFLEGEAPPGTLVAVVPGLTFSRTQYNRMPNFPRIDVGNPFLSRRLGPELEDLERGLTHLAASQI